MSVRSFGAYTAQLDGLVQWLKDCRVKTVAMESTGVYWIPLYQKLEEAGLEVLLVDVRQVKHVPGRKSDVQDCQWLQQLHSYGLLRAAFRPADSICRLRTLQRHRKSLVEFAAMWIEHMQKALNQMNLHLHHVLSDLSGSSGLRIVDAILAEERDPRKLASLADHRVKKSQTQIEAALTGDYRSELLFVLSQSLQNYRHIQHQIAQCDLSIEKQLAKIGDCANPSQASEPTPASQEGPQRKPRRICQRTIRQAIGDAGFQKHHYLQNRLSRGSQLLPYRFALGRLSLLWTGRRSRTDFSLNWPASEPRPAAAGTNQ